MKHDMQKLKQAYKLCFENANGEAVLGDLERVTNQTRITSDSPNPHAAIYKVAQQQLIQRIRNMCENTETKSRLTGE